MFTIFGSPRSGTTLLAAMIDLHPELMVPPETDFIVPTAFLVDRIGDPDTLRRLVAETIVHARGFPQLAPFISADEVRACVAAAEPDLFAIVSAIYARIARNAQVKEAGDKSPNDLRFARILEKCGYFERGMKVLHIVRDARAVTESLHRLNWPNADDPVQFARTWVHANMLLNVAMRDRPDYLLVRYEDLVSAPERIARRICAHLGVRFDPAMLQVAGRGANYDLTTPKHEKLARPISTDWILAWRRLDAAIIDEVEWIAREGLVRFGYLAGPIGDSGQAA